MYMIILRIVRMEGVNILLKVWNFFCLFIVVEGKKFVFFGKICNILAMEKVKRVEKCL